MALTVEDGTGLANAESYVSVTDADAYFAARATPTEWGAASTATKEGALRVATEWITGRYEWPGTLHLDTQALAWPRDMAYDREGRDLSAQVPTLVERATAEAAQLFLTGELIVTTLERGGDVKRETIGPITTEYMDGASSATQYPQIDAILAPIAARRSGNYVRLVRA